MTTHRHSRASHRHSLLALAVIAGLCAQNVASAQDAAPTQDAKKKTDDVTQLETVTVTAQGREQDILDVPYNISAVSGDTIEQGNILDAAELMRGVAGVGVVDRGARNSSVVSGIRIRGLNVDSSALGDYAVSASATVATYVDNTPLFANFLLSDIDRVEVLRGPQGTLYGSGAIGGAVRYLLRQPDLAGKEGRMSLGLSNADGSGSIGKSGSFTFNLPLSNTVALRFNGTHNDFPGVTDYRNVYVLDANGLPAAPSGVLSNAAQYENRKDADTVKQSYGRASLLWKPSDTFDLTLSYTAQADRFGSRRGTSLGNDGWGKPYGDNEIGSVQLEPSNRHVNLASLEANIDLGFATLTSSTSSYDHQGDIISENTGFYAKNGWLADYYYNYPRPMATAVRSYSDEAITQEFRLVSKAGGALDYVLGAYYQDQKRKGAQDSLLVGFKRWWDAANLGPDAWIVSDRDFYYRTNERFKETALYGELTWHATDTLQFTGGFRHFRVDSEAGQTMTVSPWIGSATNVAFDEESDSKTLFKGNVSWRFSPRNQLYATVSEGFRRGGTNGTPVIGAYKESAAWTTYRADTARNYEVGVKGALGNMTYNADLFYVDWTDPQINSATTNWGFFAVTNAKKASTQGVELELAGSFDNGFGYSLGYAYTEATLDAEGPLTPGVKGRTLPGVPKHRFNAAGSYNIELGKGWLILRGDAYYQSESENSLSQSAKFQQTLDGFAIFNASATYSVGNWDTTLWLKNIANEEGVTGVYKEQYMGSSPAQNYFGNGSKALTTQPRTLGVTVSYRF